jgi:hypothetical protein
MDSTQSFRLLGETNTVDIACQHVDGQFIVYWEDIEHVFPQIVRIKAATPLSTCYRTQTRKGEK